MPSFHNRGTLLSLVVMLTLAGWTAAAGADRLLVSPVAVSSQVAPIGGLYLIFGDVDIDSLGRVLFTASTNRGQVAILRTGVRGVETLLVSGQPAPPELGGTFGATVEVSGNAAGTVGFIAFARNPERLVVCRRQLDGATVTVALEGDIAPGLDARFINFDQVRILEGGEIYFSATLEDDAGDISRGVFREDGSRLAPAIIPGDRWDGERQIEETLQYDVNEAGVIAALVRVTSAGFLQAESVSEIVFFDGAGLTTLASANASLSGGFDQIIRFAVTFDQVRIDSESIASFYATTQSFPLGGLFFNKGEDLFDNREIVVQGDLSGLSGTDRFLFFGGFGISSSGATVFHAVTPARPAGAMMVLHDGIIEPVALSGDPRPDGLGIWHGFLKTEMNESNGFAFTDLSGLVQLAVYRGRLVPDPVAVAGKAYDAIRRSEVRPGLKTSLLGQALSIGQAARRGDRDGIVRAVTVLRSSLDRLERAGAVPLILFELLDPLLADTVTLIQEYPAEQTGRSPGGKALFDRDWARR